jgi:hypothetical protein
MGDPARALFTKTWGRDFLKPRAEWLYRLAVSDHQVYRHFVDPHPSTGRFVWAGAAVTAVLASSTERWFYQNHINVVSWTLLVVLCYTWAGMALLIYAEIAWGKAKPADGIWARAASWLARVLHRIPGALPVSPLVVSRFQDLWLRVAERLFIARLQLAFQFIGMGAVVGAAIGLLAGGAFQRLPLIWGSNWFDDETLYFLFRVITLPGHLAHALIGLEPMTRQEFFSLWTVEGSRPVTTMSNELNRKWLSLVILSLAVGALLPRLLAAGYLSRKVRKLRAKVQLDLSDPYYKALQRQTIAYQRPPVPDSPARPSANDKKVWWKPNTWFRKTRA